MNIIMVEGETGTNTWSWTCPSGRNAEISWLHCTYTSAAAAGNRQIVLQLIAADGSTVLADTTAGAVQAASNAYHYMFLPGIYRETSFVDNEIEVAIPDSFVVPSGYGLKLYDSASISASDTIAINFQYRDLI